MEKFAKGELKTIIFKFITKDEERLKDLDKSFVLFQKKYPNVSKTQFKDRAEMYKDENLDLENRWNDFIEETKQEETKPIVSEVKKETIVEQKELVIKEKKPTLKQVETEDKNKLTLTSYKKQVRDSIDRMKQNWGDNLTIPQKNYIETLEWNEKNTEKFLRVNVEGNFRKQKLKF